jgi:hypothetical protein
MNFLADEDVNRNLFFKKHLTEIEDYIKALESEKTACNPKLLQDVKTMSKVQREWTDGYMDRKPCDKDCYKPGNGPGISNRLISKEVGKKLREEREAWGLESQIRGDHEPFTTGREDHYEFLDKFKKDERADPDTVDPEDTLPGVESEAYHWALEEPSMIPVWLHRRLGLPNKAIKATDNDPLWYQQDGTGLGQSVGVSRRPPPQTMLPAHLHQAQDMINRDLQVYVKSGLSDELLARLEKSLAPYELQSLRALRRSFDEFIYEDSDSSSSKLAEEKRLEIVEAYKSWLDSFAIDGVQLMVGDDREVQIMNPGVFYVPSTPGPSVDDFLRLERLEARANRLLRMTLEDLRDLDKERYELASYLEAIWTPKMHWMVRKLLQPLSPGRFVPRISNEYRREIETQLAEAQVELLEPYLNSTIDLKYKLPGEVPATDQGVMYTPWSSYKQLSEPPT